MTTKYLVLCQMVEVVSFTKALGVMLMSLIEDTWEFTL